MTRREFFTKAGLALGALAATKIGLAKPTDTPHEAAPFMDDYEPAWRKSRDESPLLLTGKHFILDGRDYPDLRRCGRDYVSSHLSVTSCVFQGCGVGTVRFDKARLLCNNAFTGMRRNVSLRGVDRDYCAMIGNTFA